MVSIDNFSTQWDSYDNFSTQWDSYDIFLFCKKFWLNALFSRNGKKKKLNPWGCWIVITSIWNFSCDLIENIFFIGLYSRFWYTTVVLQPRIFELFHNENSGIREMMVSSRRAKIRGPKSIRDGKNRERRGVGEPDPGLGKIGKGQGAWGPCPPPG